MKSLSLFLETVETAWRMAWRRQRLKVPRYARRTCEEDERTWMETERGGWIHRDTCEAEWTGCSDKCIMGRKKTLWISLRFFFPKENRWGIMSLIEIRAYLGKWTVYAGCWGIYKDILVKMANKQLDTLIQGTQEIGAVHLHTCKITVTYSDGWSYRDEVINRMGSGQQ